MSNNIKLILGYFNIKKFSDFPSQLKKVEKLHKHDNNKINVTSITFKTTIKLRTRKN